MHGWMVGGEVWESQGIMKNVSIKMKKDDLVILRANMSCFWQEVEHKVELEKKKKKKVELEYVSIL